MNRFGVLTVLLLSTWIQSANAGGDEQLCETELSFFKQYMKQLTRVNSNTAQYFNLRYLSDEMKIQGIPKEELTIRLLKYTSSIDRSLNGVNLLSVNASCTSDTSRLIFKINDDFSIRKGAYIIVRLVEGKIVNVSFENTDVLIDNINIKELAYKAINEVESKSRSQNSSKSK